VILLVGLGNPGQKYDGTRHNVGFAVIDAVARRLGESFRSGGKGDYELAKTAYKGHTVILLKPMTYMNLSGKAVQHAMQFFKISVSDVLVVCDDLNIPLGAVRLRPGGSDGGQNGLKNIIQMLGRDDFARLRFGIGTPQNKGSASSHVLGKFTPEESPTVDETVCYCADAAISFIENGLSITMTRFNRKPSVP
jgi:peptidyl-tRNA hydrolase, PTH1 family